MKVNILGVQIDDISLGQAVGIVEGWMKQGGKYYIVTPNPEFVVATQKDEKFRQILNKADLAIPDGAGLKLSGQVKNTTCGVDLMEKLCQKAGEKGWRVGFLGGRDGVAKLAAKKLQKKYPGLKVVFAEEGEEVDKSGQLSVLGYQLSGSSQPVVSLPETDQQTSFASEARRVTDKLTSENRKQKTDNRSIDILFVALGMLKQEKWIAANISKAPAKVFMGVGGAFDYLSGKIPRAPVWIRELGFEWLFRLIIQPWRIKRQVNLVKFVFLILTNRIN